MSGRGIARAKACLPKGAVVEGFHVLANTRFSCYDLDVIEMEHKETGTKLVHVDTEDTNNSFCVGFCTPPVDDTGVSHILEHTALCGSQKYPVRDPFFKMRNRSLSTFMNALTYPDATLFPFATVNEKDYHNLLSVYVDAVLFPTLSKMDFLQEGHRLDVEDSVTLIKGVVFNEMKGAYADPSSLFYSKAIANTYGPGSSYGHQYGGDPKHITELTHEALVEFHRTHYSPANCTISTYGDLPIEKTLLALNEALTRRAKADLEKGVKPAKKELVVTTNKTGATKRVESTGPVDAMMDAEQSGSRVAMAWPLGVPVDDHETGFALSILATLLTEGPNAPMHKALIESGLGSSFTAGTGLADLKGYYFEVGVQGVKKGTTPEDIESKILETLSNTVKDGFQEDVVNSVIHQVELSTAHRPASWGVSVVLAVVRSSVTGHESKAIFDTLEMVKKLRENLSKNPRHLQDLLAKWIVENETQRVLHIMHPDEGHQNALTEEENEVQVPRLAKGTTEEDIKKQEASLKEEMDKVVDTSVLPSLDAKNDVPEDPLPDPEIIKLEHNRLSRFQNIITPTNGVWYFRYVIPINHLTASELLDLPLLCTLLSATGAGDMDYRELSTEIDSCCSGISAQTVIGTDRKLTSESRSALVLASYGLERNWERFFELLSLVLTKNRLDENDEAIRLRVATKISMSATNAINSVVESAHMYAVKQASAQVDKYAACHELVDGLSQVAHLKDLMVSIQDGPGKEQALTDKIVALRQLAGKLLVALPGSKASLTTSTPLSEEKLAVFNAFVDSLPSTDATPSATNLLATDNTAADSSGKVFVETPTDLGFTASVQKTDKSYLHEDAPAIDALLQIISTHFLQKEVREKGGAYGSGAITCVTEELVGMYSYRDPTPEGTQDIFGKCLEWVKAGNITDEVVNEAKLLVFAGTDAPQSPQLKGLREFLSSIQYGDVKERRRRLLAVTKEDVVRVATTLLPAQWNTPAKRGQWYSAASATVGGDKAWTSLSSTDRTWKKWTRLSSEADACTAKAA